MGPKNKYSKELIIDAAFEIARIEGIDNITMKKIAQRLGSSVAPIYVNFKNINELIDALIEKIIGVSQQLLVEENTGNPFYDMGVASLRFAMEYSELFRDLVLKKNLYLKSYDEKMIPSLVKEMEKDPELEGFTADELKNILLKMRIIQLGLSTMVANGLLLEGYERQDLVKILSSMADDIVQSARLKKGNKIKFNGENYYV